MMEFEGKFSNTHIFHTNIYMIIKSLHTNYSNWISTHLVLKDGSNGRIFTYR